MTRWRRTGLPALAVLLLGAFRWYGATLRPSDSLGLSYDDTVYFVTALTVAQGHGFTLANLPKAPPLTKFSPLAARCGGAADALVFSQQDRFLAVAGLWLRRLEGIGSCWR